MPCDASPELSSKSLPDSWWQVNAAVANVEYADGDPVVTPHYELIL